MAARWPAGAWTPVSSGPDYLPVKKVEKDSQTLTAQT